MYDTKYQELDTNFAAQFTTTLRNAPHPGERNLLEISDDLFNSIRKILAPTKIKSALPPPPKKKTQNTPPPTQKERIFPGAHKIGAAISGTKFRRGSNRVITPFKTYRADFKIEEDRGKIEED